MEELRKRINSKETFDSFCVLLQERIRDSKPISSAPMIDGLVIGFILSTGCTIDLFLENKIQVLDGTMQKLEPIAFWCSHNETALCQMIDESK